MAVKENLLPLATAGGTLQLRLLSSASKQKVNTTRFCLIGKQKEQTSATWEIFINYKT